MLAGDGLLTLAFEVMLEQKNVEPKALIETVRDMAMCAGNFGMVGGQGLDLEFEGKEITPQTVYYQAQMVLRDTTRENK